MKTLLAAVVVLALLPGCIITNTPGFYSGYKKLAPADQERIRFVAAGQPIPAASGRLIYAVTGQSLLQALPPHDTTLVYVWGPRCHGQSCASLLSVQDLCTRKSYQLRVVAEYYDMEQINLQPPLAQPLLAVNQQAYKTDYCNKYTQRFVADLTQGAQLPDSLKYARYYMMAGGRLVRAINILPNTQPQFSIFRAPGLGGR